ncbi:MAG: isochorismatase family cysteine hydrolase [archaeon]
MTSKALILVDFENEWVDENSEEYVGDISGTIRKTNRLVDFCREKDWKIIWTRHVDKNSNDAWSEDSNGTQIINDLDKKDSDVVITKYKISPFFETSLEEELKGVDEVIVCGILTNLCVRSFVQDAYDRDFDIKVIKDCCVAFDDETQEFTFRDLKATREELEFFDLDEFLDRKV